jgi:hypothetical protein
MFQPPELPKNIPVYERRIPMAYVYDSILIDPGEKQIEKFSGNTIVDELKLLYDRANDSTKTTIRAQTPEDLVYSAFESLYIHLKRIPDFKDIQVEEWKKIKNSIYIDTIIERLSDIKCLELAKYLHSKDELNEFEEQLKEYFKKLYIKSKHIYLLWSNTDTVSYYNEKDWSYNISYSQEVLYQLPRENKDTILNNQLPLGGIAYNETYTHRVFKLSLPFTDKTTKQRYGFEITNKNDSKEILKELISDKITIESQYTIKNIIWQIEFCLRYYDKQMYKGKRWFLNPVEVIQNNAKNFNLTKKPLKVKDKK